MSEIRLVLDTNIIISAAISPQSNSGKLFRLWIDHRFTLISSKELLTEITTVLSQRKYYRKFHIPPTQAENIVRILQHQSHLITLTSNLPFKLRDPKDESILLTAIDDQADYLVTGDNDLLSISSKIIKPKIITPATAVEILSHK